MRLYWMGLEACKVVKAVSSSLLHSKQYSLPYKQCFYAAMPKKAAGIHACDATGSAKKKGSSEMVYRIDHIRKERKKVRSRPMQRNPTHRPPAARNRPGLPVRLLPVVMRCCVGRHAHAHAQAQAQTHTGPSTHTDTPRSYVHALTERRSCRRFCCQQLLAHAQPPPLACCCCFRITARTPCMSRENTSMVTVARQINPNTYGRPLQNSTVMLYETLDYQTTSQVWRLCKCFLAQLVITVYGCPYDAQCAERRRTPTRACMHASCIHAPKPKA